ncbi:MULTISPECIES: PHB depolymerase family esterase [unclassified Nonomuraea]|uniref:extracellular catalytic domain type 1 short-chain-length polyhydroxyalkanoate depolymerase n=1 Tax=unclassified Nonomuraea TaxID=2593643 RepID=UPI0033EC3EB5
MRTTTKVMAMLVTLAVAVCGWLASALPTSAAALTEVTGFGANPTNLRMYEYVPASVTARPAVLVVAHYCGGSGPAMHSGTEFASLADRYGFIVVYPSVTRSSLCFDVSTPGALTHNGNSDPAGIVSMVQWEIQHRNADAGRVYATGLSSGAMMTNVLLGDYPDVFKAGAAFAGVPFGCFATTDGSMWNSTCSSGNLIKTPQQWGDLVRAAYPGYTGPRPRMQVWYGTNDTTLSYANFGEQLKQWTNVLGAGQTPALTDHPRPAWTRTRYGGTGVTAPVEGISVEGGTHNILVSGMAAMALDFMGLTTGGPTPTPTPTPTVTPAPGACRVTVTTNAWNTGLTETLTVTNTGTAPVNGWSLTFTLPAGQAITSGWNATYNPTTGQVKAANLSYNATLAPGASTSIGFQATHTGDTAKPTAFTLNAAPCTVT